MRRTAITLVALTSALTSALLLAGCKSSSGGSADAGSTASNTPAAAVSTPPASSTTSTPAASTSTGSGVATALDPCQVVTRSEASSLAGVSFGAGKEQTSNHGQGKQCVYGYQTRNVFTVEVGQASSTAEAKAEWNAAQAEAKSSVAKQLPPGVHATLDTTSVSGVGDRAATVHGDATIAGQVLGFSGIYALKGATFFAFQDLTVGASPPSIAAMTSEAKTAAGRVS